MPDQKRLIDVVDTASKITERIQPFLRIGCSMRELYDTILGVLAQTTCAPKIHADRIRAMSVAELASFLASKDVMTEETCRRHYCPGLEMTGTQKKAMEFDLYYVWMRALNALVEEVK